MTDPLRSAGDYELFLYTLRDKYPAVRRSTVTLVRLGATLARVAGEIEFDCDIRLVVRERLLFDRLPGVIDWYGYEIWRGSEKVIWYDSQPHPNDPDLQSNQPHHKHVPPNIKHHRVPAPGLSFLRANLPVVVAEVEDMLRSIRSMVATEEDNQELGTKGPHTGTA